MTQNHTYLIVEFTRSPDGLWFPASNHGGLATSTSDLNDAMLGKYKMTESGKTFWVGRLPNLPSRFHKLRMASGDVFNIKEGFISE